MIVPDLETFKVSFNEGKPYPCLQGNPCRYRDTRFRCDEIGRFSLIFTREHDRRRKMGAVFFSRLKTFTDYQELGEQGRDKG